MINSTRFGKNVRFRFNSRIVFNNLFFMAFVIFLELINVKNRENGQTCKDWVMVIPSTTSFEHEFPNLGRFQSVKEFSHFKIGKTYKYVFTKNLEDS